MSFTTNPNQPEKQAPKTDRTRGWHEYPPQPMSPRTLARVQQTIPANPKQSGILSSANESPRPTMASMRRWAVSDTDLRQIIDYPPPAHIVGSGLMESLSPSTPGLTWTQESRTAPRDIPSLPPIATFDSWGGLTGAPRPSSGGFAPAAFAALDSVRNRDRSSSPAAQRGNARRDGDDDDWPSRSSHSSSDGLGAHLPGRSSSELMERHFLELGLGQQQQDMERSFEVGKPDSIDVARDYQQGLLPGEQGTRSLPTQAAQRQKDDAGLGRRHAVRGRDVGGNDDSQPPMAQSATKRFIID